MEDFDPLEFDAYIPGPTEVDVCPHCRSLEIDPGDSEVGVPERCLNCGAAPSYYPMDDTAQDVEIATGWYLGESLKSSYVMEGHDILKVARARKEFASQRAKQNRIDKAKAKLQDAIQPGDKTKVLSFAMPDQNINRLIQTLIDEKRPDLARIILIEGIEGMTPAIADKIVTGLTTFEAERKKALARMEAERLQYEREHRYDADAIF